MDEPKVIQKRAIEVTPHNHALWCSVDSLNGGKPFANTIEWRDWSEDGKTIDFGMDTHNGLRAAPNKLIPVVEEHPDVSSEILAAWLAEDARKMAKRPVPTMPCPHCNGTGTIAEHDSPSSPSGLPAVGSRPAAVEGDGGVG